MSSIPLPVKVVGPARRACAVSRTRKTSGTERFIRPASSHTSRSSRWPRLTRLGESAVHTAIVGSTSTWYMAQYQHTEEATSKKWRRKSDFPGSGPRLRVCYDQCSPPKRRVQSALRPWAGTGRQAAIGSPCEPPESALQNNATNGSNSVAVVYIDAGQVATCATGQTSQENQE